MASIKVPIFLYADRGETGRRLEDLTDQDPLEANREYIKAENKTPHEE